MSRQQTKRIRMTKETEPRKDQWKTLFFFFLAAFLFLLWGSWLLPVTDPVESNYALTAKEMVQSGNWMSPQIYGTYWYDKPIMVYWLLSSATPSWALRTWPPGFPPWSAVPCL